MTSLKSFNDAGFQFAWDATSISAFEKCPRYYQLRHLEGWQPRRKSEHLSFGGWYASALETHQKLLASGVEPEQALLQIVRDAMISTWEHERDESGARIPGTGAAWVSLHAAKTRETLIRSIVWYVDNFADDPTSIVILADGKPATEHSFSIPLTDAYVYCGHLDRVVEYAGGKYIMDQKTSGSTITQMFFDGFKPDIQMAGYTWAGKQIFNMPVSGVIIDAAQIAVGFTRFVRGFIPYPEPLLNEWYETTLATIEEAKRSHESNHYAMRRTSCSNYGGCDFRKVCSRIPQHRPAVLNAEFTREKRWDPLERR